MIDFKQIQLQDKKTIDTAFAGNNYRACDFSFTNLYAWNCRFRTVYAIHNRTIFLRFIDADDKPSYMMPIGRMGLQEAFDLMRADAKENNFSFRMKAITIEMWEQIEATMPGQYKYNSDRDNDEYIYLSSKLISLSGKKLQSKRNHINRFKADHPNWHYTPIITKEDAKLCVAMLEKWEQENSSSERSLQHDYIATMKMLNNYQELDLVGGAIKVDGRIIAFSIGEPLTEDTFVVHVEKAFGDMNGAYTIINQQFVEHQASEFTYINREEDMGLENLRKAKMSYYPEILLQEGAIEPLLK